MNGFRERADDRWARLNGGGHVMSTPTNEAIAPAKEMLSDLYHLIDALDRRVPRLERVGEAEIARNAVDLRERANRLIRQIEATVELVPTASE
jgi:hypothetical protein